MLVILPSKLLLPQHIAFNEGEKGLLPVFQKLGIEPGYYTITGFEKADMKRTNKCNRKNQESEKKRRKKLRAFQKGFEDKNAQEEGEIYGYGAF